MNPRTPEVIGGDRGPEPGTAEFESLLRQMPLAPPSKRLDMRMRELLRPPLRIARFRAAIVGVAAAIVLLVGLALIVHQRFGTNQTASNKASPAPVVPIVSISRPLRIERNGATMADAGIVGFAGQTPLHGYRYESVRQIWYVDQQGRRLCVTIPDRRIVLVPVHPF